LKFYQRVPPEVVRELAKVTSEAFVAWREAKEKAKFNIFAPYLEKNRGADQGGRREVGI
jgi:carboxypeptidase Taq